jgi:hypothetical protein
MVKTTARMKKQISRVYDFRSTRNSLTNAIEPATTPVIKLAAPISSPTAILALLEPMAAKVLNTSGDPLPKARNVTPAKLSLRPRTVAIVLRLTLKKSLAAMPMVVKRRPSQSTRAVNAMGLTLPKEQ